MCVSIVNDYSSKYLKCTFILSGFLFVGVALDARILLAPLIIDKRDWESEENRRLILL